MSIPEINIGDKLICTVCGTEFKATTDTVYITKGGYTCSRKCFLDNVKDAKNKKKQSEGNL